MSFSNIIKKKYAILLPVSWLYYAGVVIHNKLYRWGFKQSKTYNTPIICVGNLSVGGTGKTPMVEYLLRLLSKEYPLVTVSRGYKRKTKGLVVAAAATTAGDIGDEPMQFHTNFPDVTVMVDEDRNRAVAYAIQHAAGVIILDDAFQHRAITAGLNILLTDYSNLFMTDEYLPAGQLRDLKSNYKNAAIIVVTKCPAAITAAEKEKIISDMRPVKDQQVFFAATEYGRLQHVFTKAEPDLHTIKEVVLVTGIANPAPLISYLNSYNVILHVMSFNDHHDFQAQDIQQILDRYRAIDQPAKMIITTEKDAVKLSAFENSFRGTAIAAIPVMHRFLFGEAGKFDRTVKNYITGGR